MRQCCVFAAPTLLHAHRDCALKAMYHRVLVAGRVGSVVAGRHGVLAGGPVHHTQRGMTAVVRGSTAALPGKRWAQQPHYQGHQQVQCGCGGDSYTLVLVSG